MNALEELVRRAGCRSTTNCLLLEMGHRDGCAKRRSIPCQATNDQLFLSGNGRIGIDVLRAIEGAGYRVVPPTDDGLEGVRTAVIIIGGYLMLGAFLTVMAHLVWPL